MKKKAKEEEKARKAEERKRKEEEAKAAKAAADSVDVAADSYGRLPLHQSQDDTPKEPFKRLETIGSEDVGKTITFRARLANSRQQGNKMLFCEFRQSLVSIQGLLELNENKEGKPLVSKQMMKFCAAITLESLVLVEGKVTAVDKPVESTTIKNFEVHIGKMWTVIAVNPLPIQITAATQPPPAEDASEEAKQATIGLDTRLNYRVIDLRTRTNQAIFRIRSGVKHLFREYLDARGFIEFETPKLQGAMTESGASVFNVKYFERPAFLAQSPQLAKQMIVSGDFDRMYEIGPVFRAENSWGPRHMTEFTGMDIEMAIEHHYHEVVSLLEDMLIFIFHGLNKRFGQPGGEIEWVRKQWPSEPFVVPEKAVRLRFSEGIQMLREAGRDLEELEDLGTEDEKMLGRLVKERYNTDFFVLDKFPAKIRPFYTMPDPHDPRYSNSYDFFMRGQEILSGAQRVHDAELLKQQMAKVVPPIDPSIMKDYINAFEYGAPPHAGAGLGLDRIVQFFLNLPNIRLAVAFPRDPGRIEP